MMKHELKIWPRFFEATNNREKTFEIRKNDRNFSVGDLLHLREYDPESGKYTGREVYRIISGIFYNYDFIGIKPGFVILFMKDVDGF